MLRHSIFSVRYAPERVIAHQPSLLWRAFNEYTKHQCRLITLKESYLGYPTDIVYDRAEPFEIIEVLSNSDFFIFVSQIAMFPFYPMQGKLNRNNHLIMTYGSEVRLNSANFLLSWLRSDTMIVTSHDYSQSSPVGFSCQHIPISCDFNEIPERMPPGDDVIRVCHTPTSPTIKGTEQFLKVMEKIKEAHKDLKIETVLIEGKPWSECLRLKSQCDICYDQMSIGSYGMCLLPNQFVVANPSAKLIQDVNVGDKVLTGNGFYRKVQAVASRNYSGKVVKIIPWNYAVPLTVTSEHEVLAVKPLKRRLSKGKVQAFKPNWKNVNANTGWRQYKQERLAYEPTWIKAKDLEKADFVFYPMLKRTAIRQRKKLRVIDFIPAIQKKGYAYAPSHNQFGRCRSRSKMPKVLPLTKELVSLCGLYVAEGSSTHGISFALNINEVELAKSLKQWIRTLFNVEPKERERVSSNGREIWVNSTVLKQLFRAWFGVKASEKRLPLWIFQLPTNLIVSFLKYAFRGDGNLNRGQYLSYKYTTVSDTLARQLFTLLLQAKIIPALNISHDDNGFHSRTTKYVLNIFGEQLQNLKFFDEATLPRHHKTHAFFYKGMLCLPIRKITQEDYTGLVYDIQIPHHSFVAEGIIVHNSVVESWAMRQPVVGRANAWVRSWYPDVPILDATPETLQQRLEDLVTHMEFTRQLGEEGRRFCELNHDVQKNIRKLENLIRWVGER